MGGGRSDPDPPRPTSWQTGGHRVIVERPESITYLPPQPSNASAHTTEAMIVIALTLASTVLSIYDLFLLANGAS